jgi:hypothetical protein
MLLGCRVRVEPAVWRRRAGRVRIARMKALLHEAGPDRLAALLATPPRIVVRVEEGSAAQSIDGEPRSTAARTYSVRWLG